MSKPGNPFQKINIDILGISYTQYRSFRFLKANPNGNWKFGTVNQNPNRGRNRKPEMELLAFDLGTFESNTFVTIGITNYVVQSFIGD